MARGKPNTASLFDFLYIDTLRLASYYAQLFDTGVLSQTKTTSQSGGQETKSGKLKMAVAEDGMLSQETVSESLERQLDENWSVALDALASLQESAVSPTWLQPDSAV